MDKIALEEHCLLPGFEDYWLPTVADMNPTVRDGIRSRLSDIGEMRGLAMEAAGISHSILSLSGPGVQAERDTTVAVRMAKKANDLLAEAIHEQRTLYSGFAHLALQDGIAAADELERCVRDLGFKGALINGNTNGIYLDDPSLYPLWERAEALGTVLYLHPGDPVATMPIIDGQPGLKRAMWEWTVETGSHALRLIMGGTFDRFPKATLALGHLGETLPYLLWRFDSRARIYGLPLRRKPSEYIRENIVVTLSGMFSREPLVCAIEALGKDRVLFSADYPFESAEEATAFIDTVDLPNDWRAAVCHENARRIFDLK